MRHSIHGRVQTAPRHLRTTTAASSVLSAAINPLLFHGTLLNQQGAAIQNAKVQLWQTDLNGNYLHPASGAALNPISPDHASIVSNFQYFGTDATDSDGHFEFLTYRPGVYPNRPYSHFHFMVWLNDVDNGGYTQALVTQFYFKGESPPGSPDVLQLDLHEVDPGKMCDYGSYVNDTIVIESISSSTGDASLEITPEQSLGPFYPIPDFFSMDNDLTAADDVTTPISPPVSLPTSPPASAITITVQAESYLNMQGVKNEDTTDEGSGKNVGYIDGGD